MRFVLMSPFFSLLVWMYSGMFEVLEVKPKIFKVIKRIAGILAWLGIATILILAYGGFHL